MLTASENMKQYNLPHLSKCEQQEVKDLLDIVNNLSGFHSSWRFDSMYPLGYDETWFMNRIKSLKDKNDWIALKDDDNGAE